MLIEIPDALFLKAQEAAAARGSSVEAFFATAIADALELGPTEKVHKISLPLVVMPAGTTVDPSTLNFDEFLA